MDPSDGIPGGTILEFVVQGGIRMVTVKRMTTQYQVEGSGSGMRIPPRPVLEVVTPEAPKLRSTRGDLEPVMANEQEVVGFFLQPVKVVLQGDVPTEYLAKDFGGELENVQQRVPSAFELDKDLLVLSNLLV